jgi:hypothetical protein
VFDLDRSLERVHARAREEHGRRVGAGPALAHQLRIARAGGIPHACEQSARLFQAKAFEQFTAQCPQ